MNDIHHIRRLREVKIRELRGGVGGRDLDGCSWRSARHLPAVFVNSKAVVKKFQNIRLLHVELKIYQPGFGRMAFTVGDIPGAWSSRCPAMRMHQEVLHDITAVVIFCEIRATAQTRRQLSSCKITKGEIDFGHRRYRLELTSTSAWSPPELVTPVTAPGVPSVASVNRASDNFDSYIV